MLHPHQSLFTVPLQAVVPVPEGVPPMRAVLTANMETALNALWDAAPGPADRIAVVGAGVLGALLARLCARIPGTDVTLVDIDPARAELARMLGVRFAEPDVAPEDCDLVFHASASAAGLATALRLRRHGGDDRRAQLVRYRANTGAARREPSTAGACGSSRARWAVSRPRIARVGVIADVARRRSPCSTDPVLDALLAPAIPFDDLPARLPDILAPAGGVLCKSSAIPTTRRNYPRKGASIWRPANR